jgi:2-polyprenyl-3-methyl-5-hydroxy-6-metoxy-1,4-benzoquinol methylase
LIAHFAIDTPSDHAVVQRHGFAVSGWIDPAGGRTMLHIHAQTGDDILGSTRVLYRRPDVNAMLDFGVDDRTGFLINCTIPVHLRERGELTVSVIATQTNNVQTLLGMRTVVLSEWDYRGSGHGYQLEDGFSTVMPRDRIYASGPPSPVADQQCVDLIARYLNPGMKVLDVGCGIGAYGTAIAERGMEWTGCEVRQDFVAAAQEAGLDARLVTDGRLPFADESFDAAIAVEVLEHIPDPDPFLAEVKRVAPNAAYFSVPNFEAIPITSAFYALPWHMLEPDHWNFFSRGSLKALLARFYPYVEVFEYGPLPQLRSLDNLPIFNHLFAVARGGP